ncbi:MAG TPA: hypothetical protein VLK27_02900 [Chthoniobacterales bacterium]|nr:hypothetical protein [Chthoniobacterales bacterium]
MAKNFILQIVPRVPGGLDGVGDYALTLAEKLRDQFGFSTIFATPNASSVTTVREFEVHPLDRIQDQPGTFDHVLLHYVSYGYQKRGIPFGLLSILRRMARNRRGVFLTVFHELYASGPPWRSEFWLKPIQIHLARSVAHLSDECIVASENYLHKLQRLVPNTLIHLHPTPSGLGEPSLSREQVANRDPHRWAIVGGTLLGEKSLGSFARVIQQIPESIAPKTLFLLGGSENPAVRSILSHLEIESHYRPRIAAADASEVLKTCSFAWIDYFHRPDIETSVVLKSSAFAAACAHAVIPVFPHRGTPISIERDRLPGPFFVESNAADVPTAEDRSTVAANIYDWYHRHVSSESLVRGIAESFGIKK